MPLRAKMCSAALFRLDISLPNDWLPLVDFRILKRTKVSASVARAAESAGQGRAVAGAARDRPLWSGFVAVRDLERSCSGVERTSVPAGSERFGRG
jgi:hypothetical protein